MTGQLPEPAGNRRPDAPAEGRRPDIEVDVITIFPDYLTPLRASLLGKAIQRGQVRLGVHDLRDWTTDVHRTVDDAPYGGGPGMVMLAEPWALALDSILLGAAATQAGDADRADDRARAGRQARLVVPTPAGRPFTQQVAAELAREPWLVFGCGRYEGIDARVLDYAAQRMVVDEISIGDYVLCGGEAAVLVIMEAVARLIPGVLGNAMSARDDSFTEALGGLLEAPAYTRPASWRGLDVPEVLLSGDHGKVAQWRAAQSLARTRRRRPDLLDGD